MKKLIGLAALTICVAFALSLWLPSSGFRPQVQAQGAGVRVVASCGAAGYPLGAVREWTMSTAGVIC